MGLSVLNRFFDYLIEIDLEKILITQIVETDLDIILNLVTMEQTNAYGNSCRRRLRVVSENEENEPGTQSVAKVLLERKQQSRSLKRLLDQTNEGEVFATPVQLSNGASYPPTAPRKVRKLQTKETVETGDGSGYPKRTGIHQQLSRWTFSGNGDSQWWR